MKEKIIKISDIKPIDDPRQQSFDFVMQIWGQEGPPEAVIDLTHLDHVVIHTSEGYLSDDMNNRLGYLYMRLGGQQKVKVNVQTKRESRAFFNAIVAERALMISKGILSWQNWLGALKDHQTEKRLDTYDDDLNYSPFFRKEGN